MRKKNYNTNLLLVVKAILNNEATNNHKALSLIRLFERQKKNLSETMETKKILEIQEQAYENGYEEGYDTCYEEARDLGFDMASVNEFMANGGDVTDEPEPTEDNTAEVVGSYLGSMGGIKSPYNDVF